MQISSETASAYTQQPVSTESLRPVQLTHKSNHHKDIEEMVTLTQTFPLKAFTVKTRSVVAACGIGLKKSEEVQSHGEVYENRPLDMEYLQALPRRPAGQHHSLHSHFWIHLVDHLERVCSLRLTTLSWFDLGQVTQ